MTKNIFSSQANFLRGLLIFGACSAGLSLQSAEIEQVSENSLLHATHRRHKSSSLPIKPPCKSKKKQKIQLKLSDLAGSWILNDSSVGGIGSGNGGTRAIQLQVDIDKFGKGTVHFFQTAGYTGGANEMDYSAIFNKNFAQFSFEILDPQNGVGRFTVEVEGHNPTNSLFIATFSSKSRKAIKLEGMSNDSSLDKTNIRTFTFTRQYVD